ncbi:MAG: hypothetical protein WC756_21180 [Taibaiella sp.]|jgi:hypothetical protein
MAVPVEQIELSQGLATQKFLTTSGDGLGTYNLNGNYAAAPTDFYYKATSQYDIHSLLIVITDGAKFNQPDYGAITGGVTNGVKLFVRPAGSAADIALLSGVAVKQNHEWLSLTHDTNITSFEGLPQTLMVNFNIVTDYGKPITLGIGDKFIVRLNDDFTGLISHTFGLRGVKA